MNRNVQMMLRKASKSFVVRPSFQKLSRPHFIHKSGMRIWIHFVRLQVLNGGEYDVQSSEM
jgi:hypothetical protein